ncbi:hypothetical protein TNCT_306921 [Trichonephila clavata]|uniref:Ribosomal protein S10 n=1 Tax=Trichonephila clavata TaxID=2740835 RepID=A0A8X6LAN8_TRICU|nr:hypothetical protein TNCT_306921 [Trichonephila clavata]
MTGKLSFKASNLKLLPLLVNLFHILPRTEKPNKSDNANARKVRFRTGIRVHCKALRPNIDKLQHLSLYIQVIPWKKGKLKSYIQKYYIFKRIDPMGNQIYQFMTLHS